MSLNSPKFIVFYAICYLVILIVSLIFRKNTVVRKTIWKSTLLVFSLLFTALTDIRYLIVILLYSVAIYFIALRIEKKEKSWVQIGVIVSVLLLGTFKYFNFFIGSISELLGIEYHALQIILPVGLSFYSLSGISYIIDIKRVKYKADHNPLDVLLYITFFGKLSAGPIVRFNTFNDSLIKWDGASSKDFTTGVQIFVIGLFKKMVIADHLGVFVDDVFFAPNAYSSLTVLWAVISYSLQIYFDFSGYSDIAIGCSRMLGLRFEKNFNFPYLSRNMTEFWKRWHISLSSWFQEYLYYPLGGNRKGKVRTYINLFLVMLVSGLWHGAAWTFVVWGALHGLGLIIHKLWREKGKKWSSKTWTIVSVILTDAYAFFCWIFFRASSFENASDVIKTMIVPNVGITQPYTWTIFAVVVLILATVIMIRQNRTMIIPTVDYPLADLNTIKGLTVFFVLIGLTIGLAYVGNTAFIYGAF